jgi:hypothetical protein
MVRLVLSRFLMLAVKAPITGIMSYSGRGESEKFGASGNLKEFGLAG